MTFEEAMQAEMTITVSRKEMENLVQLVGQQYSEQARTGPALSSYNLLVKMRAQVPECFPRTYDED